MFYINLDGRSNQERKRIDILLGTELLYELFNSLHQTYMKFPTETTKGKKYNNGSMKHTKKKNSIFVLDFLLELRGTWRLVQLFHHLPIFCKT